MPPAARPPPVEAVERDFGPDIRQKATKAPRKGPRQGRPLPEPDPGRLVVKEYRRAPDKPDGPLIRGGRVRDPLRKMHEAKYISTRQWHGVERFRDDWALSQGARELMPDNAGVRSPPTNRNWPTDTQLLALERVTRTMAVLDEFQVRLMIWTVLWGRPLTDFVRDEHIRNETGSKLLQFVLTILADRHT